MRMNLWKRKKQKAALTWFYTFCVETITKNSNCRLDRDDGLVIMRNVNGQQIGHTSKNKIKIFKDIGFSIGIVTNSKVIDFLDITFILNNGIYKPY